MMGYCPDCRVTVSGQTATEMVEAILSHQCEFRPR